MKAIVNETEFNALPDVLKAEYVKIEDGDNAGSYLAKIDEVGGFVLEDVGGLKSALSAARSERDAAKASAKAFEGLDPAKAKEALEKMEELAGADPEGKAREQIEAIKRQLEEKHGKELGELKEVVSQRDTELHELLVVSAATQALAKAGANVELLMPHVAKRMKVERDADGKPVARVLQEDGKNVQITMKQGSTDPMGVSEFVESLKSSDTFSAAFKGSDANGSGSEGSSSGGGSGSSPGEFGSYRQALADKRSAAGASGNT